MRNKLRPSEERSNRINDIFMNQRYEELEDMLVNIAESYLGFTEKVKKHKKRYFSDTSLLI